MLKIRIKYLALVLTAFIFSPGVWAQGPSQVFVESFDQDQSASNWDIWSRQAGLAKVRFDNNGMNGTRCLVIDNRGDKDWIYEARGLTAVRPGETYDYQGYARVQGQGALAMIGLVVLDQEHHVQKTQYTSQNVKGPSYAVNKADQWFVLSRSFIVPEGAAFIRLRLMGVGQGRFWFDNVRIIKQEGPKTKLPPQVYHLENPALRFDFDSSSRMIHVTDKRIGQSWDFVSVLEGFSILEIVRKNDLQIDLLAVGPEAVSQYLITMKLHENLPEIFYEIEQKTGGEFTEMEFPPFVSMNDHMQFVVPLQQGLLLPADLPFKDFPWRLRYGAAWPMAFIGAVDNERGWMEFVETPIDFELRREEDSRSRIALKNFWISEKGRFGYKRVMRHCFFDRGGYTAMAKWYRKFAVQRDLFKNLLAKFPFRKHDMGKLIGAVDIRYGGDHPLKLVRDFQRQGINKAVISNLDDTSEIKRIKDFGFLTSVTTDFQDVLIPVSAEVTAKDRDGRSDLIRDKRGDGVRWSLRNQGSGGHLSEVLCSVPSLPKARQEISQIVKQKAPESLLIQFPTASPLWECYDPGHPTNRGQDLENKIHLLSAVANEQGLITGCEDGADYAVPYCDYLEGMMSIRIGRLAAGRVTELKLTREFWDYNIREKYRIPLWQFVFGDALISTWHETDSSNLIPAVWWRKDLWNILYGTMPLWTIPDEAYWNVHKARFTASYQNIHPVLEKLASRELLEHAFVTEDHRVQMTRFQGDITVFVNFGSKDFPMSPIKNLPPHGFAVMDHGKLWKKGICR